MDKTQYELPVLAVAQYKIRFNIGALAHLPRFLGSAVRGAFGHALKRTVCVTRLKQCDACLLYRSCPYSYIFETPAPLGTEKMRLYNATPHPFVFDLPPFTPTDMDLNGLDIGFSLFGRGSLYLAYIIHALQQAGEQGIGSRRVKFLLDKVEQRADWQSDEWQEIYKPGERLEPLPPFVPKIPALPENIQIKFITPLRLRRDERYLDTNSFQFSDLLITLMRRISMLTYFHTDTAHETNFARLAARAKETQFTQKELRWHDWARYSSRQNTKIEMGGLIGCVSLALADVEEFWPYLWLGQWTHVGKGTSMGLGRYEIESSASLPAASAAIG